MSKLPEKYRFLDLSDYGRPVGHWIAYQLKSTIFTPIHVTTMFIIAGLIAIAFMINGYYITASFFIILKSILDAADGELSRLKNTPSYVGRYYDSIADFLLNFCFLLAFWYITEISILYMLFAFFAIQLQGTVYNFYYVILRNRFEGDTTSRVFEDTTPLALPGEKQQNVNTLFFLYKLFYGVFDKIIYALDRNASQGKPFPNWLMTLISTFGLGFQLLLISLFLVLGLKTYIIPFFIGYSVLIFVFICIRKIFY